MTAAGEASGDLAHDVDARRAEDYLIDQLKGHIDALNDALHSMWKAILLIIVMIVLAIGAQFFNRQEILASRENNFKGRSVPCLNLLVDNDWTLDLPDACKDPRVTRYYPDAVCHRLSYLTDCGG